ncbi:MAG: hypothetical protein ABH983_00800 [Candidatus Micrarchaeota archaeon]
MYAYQGSWDTFFRSIDGALAAVKKFEEKCRKLEYVVVNESLMGVIDSS